MREFTFKDLIKLNQLCFICGRNCCQTMITSSEHNDPITSSLKNDLLIANIKNSYKEGAYELIIDIATNHFKFVPVNAQSYIQKIGGLRLLLKCNGCNSYTYTNDFQFDKSGFILPLSLHYQVISLIDDDYLYTITTNFNPNINISRIVIDVLTKTYPLSPMKINVKAFSIYDFENVQELIKKIKLYMIFS